MKKVTTSDDQGRREAGVIHDAITVARLDIGRVIEAQGICDIFLDMRFSKTLVQGDFVPGQRDTGKEV